MAPLYKFIGNPLDVKFLLEGALKFTPIPELNDPSELLATTIREDVAKSLRRIRRHGYSDNDYVHLLRQGKLLQKLAPRFQAIAVPKTKEAATAVIRSQFYSDFSEKLERLLDETAQAMSSKVGLFCLTERNDSLPMWAYYAGNAKGLIVEFGDLADTFSGDDTGVLREPIAVRYERESFGVTFDPQSHESLFFAKFRDWSHEREVRVVMPLADCRQASNDERQLYLFDVPRRHVSRVILGWQMAPVMVDQVVERVRTINPSVHVVRASVARGQVRCDQVIYQ